MLITPCHPGPSLVFPDHLLSSGALTRHPGLDPGSMTCCGHLQRAATYSGSRVFARDDASYATDAVIPSPLFSSRRHFCHPGLDPGSMSSCGHLQRAATYTGSRVFARDDATYFVASAGCHPETSRANPNPLLSFRRFFCHFGASFVISALLLSSRTRSGIHGLRIKSAMTSQGPQ